MMFSKRLLKNDSERYSNGTYKEFYRSFDTLMENTSENNILWNFEFLIGIHSE
ncbi:hypothetical protein OAT18_00360 [Tenacibaculum sp.]|nr:hypothetical protein [Tenacibaculum sp.]